MAYQPLYVEPLAMATAEQVRSSLRPQVELGRDTDKHTGITEPESV